MTAPPRTQICNWSLCAPCGICMPSFAQVAYSCKHITLESRKRGFVLARGAMANDAILCSNAQSRANLGSLKNLKCTPTHRRRKCLNIIKSTRNLPGIPTYIEARGVQLVVWIRLHNEFLQIAFLFVQRLGPIGSLAIDRPKSTKQVGQ